jgi:hypothetical protein
VHGQRIMERGTTIPEKFMTQTGTPIPTIIASPKLASALLQSESRTANQIFEAGLGAGLPAPFALKADKRLTINVVCARAAVA